MNLKTILNDKCLILKISAFIICNFKLFLNLKFVI